MAQFGLPENSKILKGNYYEDKTGSDNLKKINVIDLKYEFKKDNLQM